MAQMTADFEAGTNGNTIATTDAGSASAWNAVNIGTTGAAIYSTTQKAHGSLSGRLSQGATSSATYLTWNHSPALSGDHYGRAYFYWPGGNPAAARLIVFAKTTGSGAWRITVDTGGTISIQNSSAATVATSTWTVPASAGWIRIEWFVTQNNTTGQISLRFFSGANFDGTTPDTNGTLATSTFDTLGTIDQMLFGIILNAANFTLYLDDLVSGAATWTGPAATAAPPSNTVAPAVTGTAQQGQTLTTDNGTWTNSPTGYTYQWQRDTAGNGTFANISAATANTYILQAADVGNRVRCVVTATNASGSASANSNATAIVTLPPAPTNSVAPVVAGTAALDGTLRSSTGTWANNPASYAYQWARAGSNISGATTASYVVTSADVGVAITCVVTATNVGGSGSATSNSVTPTAFIAGPSRKLSDGTKGRYRYMPGSIGLRGPG